MTKKNTDQQSENNLHSNIDSISPESENIDTRHQERVNKITILKTDSIDQSTNEDIDSYKWEVVDKLKSANWLNSAPSHYLSRVFKSANIEMMFVGGCVRDSLLGIDSTDVDIATTATPDQVIQALEDEHLKYDVKNKRYGIIIVKIDYQTFEIASLRSEVYHDNNTTRYPDEIHFITNWIQDSLRRDFTCNAIYCDIEGNLYDPLGGVNDIRESKLKFVGDADTRIKEDPLRILRFFRFYTMFDIKQISYFTEKIIKDNANLLTNISIKILFREMRLILAKPNLIDVVILMDKTKILRIVLGISNPDINLLREILWLEKRAIILSGILPDPIRRLNSLVSFDFELSNDLVARLNLDSYDAATMLFLSQAFHTYNVSNYDDIFQKLGDTLNLSHMRNLIVIAWAFDRAYSTEYNKKSSEYWLHTFAKLEYNERDLIPIIESKISTIGFSKGYVVGKSVRKLETERLKKCSKKGQERLSDFIEKYI